MGNIKADNPCAQVNRHDNLDISTVIDANLFGPNVGWEAGKAFNGQGCRADSVFLQIKGRTIDCKKTGQTWAVAPNAIVKTETVKICCDRVDSTLMPSHYVKY